MTEIAREGARQMLTGGAQRGEAGEFMSIFSAKSCCPTGGGALCELATSGEDDPDRDRADHGAAARGARPGDERAEAEKIRFTSVILPRWARRSSSLDALLPVLYLRGISTGDFQEALAGLLGKDAPEPLAFGDRAADGGLGGRLSTAGVAVTCRPAATSTSGPTGITSRPAWSQSRNACWW